MIMVVLTKWTQAIVTGIGTVKKPECSSVPGVVSYQDITCQLGSKINTGHFLLCLLDVTPTVGAQIESSNLGVVLWTSGNGPLKAADVAALAPKLTAYGVPASAKSKIIAGTPLATMENQIKTILQGQ